MNHINWVQQDPDYKTEYHVLKWRSSHFHEPQARRMVDSALHKEGASSAVSAGNSEPGITEIGLGPASAVRSGGFGLGQGLAGTGIGQDSDIARGQDMVSISVQGAEKQSSVDTKQSPELVDDSVAGRVMLPGIYEAAMTSKEAVEKSVGAAEQSKAGHNTVAATAGQGGIRNRLKQSAAFVQEEYQKQKAKIKRTLFRPKKVEKQIETPKKTAKEADKEKILSMQAQNHYLLDSYDRNGQYHMLGK